jgi:hypothetical protein
MLHTQVLSKESRQPWKGPAAGLRKLPFTWEDASEVFHTHQSQSMRGTYRREVKRWPIGRHLKSYGGAGKDWSNMG